MTEPEALARIRVLRAAGYRCQVSAPGGMTCGARASKVSPLTAEGLARCSFHAEDLEAAGRVRRKPRSKT